MGTSICFFNNKGGVGKTTLACNVASFLAQERGLRVILIDADPQCNATQLVLGESITSDIYKKSAGAPGYQTLADILSPLQVGDAQIASPTTIVPADSNRFGIALLPGHPRIALLEDKLSSNWSSYLGGDPGGARVSNWNYSLSQILRKDYDILIYDVGPSLGALNRAVLIGVDFFLAPMGCDIFSLIGIENIADWIKDWHSNYDDAHRRCLSKHRDTMAQFSIRDKASEMSRFIGYTVQQYITKSIRGERRATQAYEKIRTDIPKRVFTELSDLTPSPLRKSHDLQLGDVPHMYSLVPLAQTSHAPIHGLLRQDGVVGGQFAQLQDYKPFIEGLTDSVLRNLKTAGWKP